VLLQAAQLPSIELQTYYICACILFLSGFTNNFITFSSNSWRSFQSSSLLKFIFPHSKKTRM